MNTNRGVMTCNSHFIAFLNKIKLNSIACVTSVTPLSKLTRKILDAPASDQELHGEIKQA